MKAITAIDQTGGLLDDLGDALKLVKNKKVRDALSKLKVGRRSKVFFGNLFSHGGEALGVIFLLRSLMAASAGDSVAYGTFTDEYRYALRDKIEKGSISDDQMGKMNDALAAWLAEIEADPKLRLLLFMQLENSKY